MRVVTWNIELGKDIELAAEELLGQPDLKNADLILVQEMSPASTDQLSSLLGIPALYDAVATHPKTGLPFGNAILSPWPLSDPQNVALPHTALIDGQARSVLFATADIDGDQVVVGSIHLETVLLDVRRRSRQVVAAAQHLDQTTQPCIIGGDFNSASRRSLRAFDDVLRKADVHRLSTEEQPTFHRFGRPFFLDHIFGRGVTRIESGVVEAAAASDHDPVWAIVELDENRPLPNGVSN
ncbi:MAG: endonuclease/exonuclease/phosphatase family metal-dependent hydrolase [Candidatus Poriferisodalaceae bacterium]|jgi:endonuclease/exonuclease/phosphatase family metal-dependent hydrolase